MKAALRYIVLNILWHYTIAYYQTPINPYTYNNIYNNGYYRTIYNKRNALPQYTSLLQPIQTVNQYPDWADNGPRTPSWAFMYNKLAAKRKQEMSNIEKKNKAQYQQPFHHIVTKTFAKINNPSLQIAQRRMFLQQEQAVQNKVILEKNIAERDKLLFAKTSAAKKKFLMEKTKPAIFQNISPGKTQLLASKNGLIPLAPQRNMDYRILPSIKLNTRLPLVNKQYIPVNYQSIYQHPSSVKPFMPGSITPVLFFNKNPKANSELWKTINAKRRAQISFARKKIANKQQVANRFTQIPYSITFKRIPVHQLKVPYPIQNRNSIPITTLAKNSFLKEYSKKTEIKTTKLLEKNVDNKSKQGTTKLKTLSYTLHPVSSAAQFHIKNQALSFTKSKPRNYKKSEIITVKGNGTLINSNKTLVKNSNKTLVKNSYKTLVKNTKNNKNHTSRNTSNNHNNKTLQFYKNHEKPALNHTKTNISHGQVLNKKTPIASANSWKRHHVFRPSQGNVSNGTEEWEYKRYRIYHRKEPSYYTTSKREHLEIPVVYSNIDDGFDVDDIFNEDDEAPADNDLSDIIEDEDEDLPDPKQKLKIPIVNIETPNTSDLPENIKNQIQETVQPVYRIIKGKVKSANEFREPLSNGFIHNKAMKDVLSVRKSEVRGDLFNDYVPNDNEAVAPKMPTDKSKMNEEELEAFKEEQAAESLMKTPDADKPKTEDPEMLGVGKPPIDLPGKHLSGAGLTDSSVAGGGLTLHTRHEHREMFNHGDIKPPTVESNKYLDNPPYGSMTDLSYAHHVHEKARTPETMSYKARNERLVDKARISDGELDFHHPVNEMNSAFETFEKDKFSDYEKYKNEEQEGNVPPIQRDDMDIHHEHEHRYSNDRSDERGSRNEGGRSEYGRRESGRHEGARSEGGRSEGGRHEPENLKPIEYTMKQGEETVDEAINKLQNTDNFDPDKLSASLMDDNKHFHHDREREEEMNPYHATDRSPYHGLESSSYHGSEHSYHGEHSAKDIYHDDPSRIDPPDEHYPPEPIKKFNHMVQSDSIDPAGHMDPAAAMNDESMVDSGLANPLKNGMSMEDMLDPEKAQESANNLEEQVEVAKKLNRELPTERTLEPSPPPPPPPPLAMPPPPSLSNVVPNGDINSHYTKTLEMNDDMMPRNIRGVLKQEGEKPFSEVANDPMKVQELTPEDALHALNGKKSLKELLETNRVDDEHYGPPDAVINKQFSGYVKSINPFPVDGRASTPLVSKSENPLINSRINTLDINKINSIGRLLEVKNDTDEKVLNNSSPVQSTPSLIVSSSSPNASTTAPSNISSTIITPMKTSDASGDIHISELQNTTVTKEVVNILESIGQLKPASNFSSPIASYINSDNKTTTADTKALVPPVNNTKPEITVTKVDNKSSTVVDNKTSSDNSTEDLEEKETKEAVHDLNIAISILEKKLSLISAAKKSGNKKAIYIVDETLRNSKPVTKSIIAMHKHVNHNVIKTTRHKIYHQQPVLNAVIEQPVLGVVPKKVKKHVIHENKYKHKRKTAKHLKKHITNRKLHHKKYKKTRIKKSHHRDIKKKSVF